MYIVTIKCADGRTAYVPAAHITHVMDYGPNRKAEVHLTGGAKLVVAHAAQNVYGALLRNEDSVS